MMKKIVCGEQRANGSQRYYRSKEKEKEIVKSNEWGSTRNRGKDDRETSCKNFAPLKACIEALCASSVIVSEKVPLLCLLCSARSLYEILLYSKFKLYYKLYILLLIRCYSKGKIICKSQNVYVFIQTLLQESIATKYVGIDTIQKSSALTFSLQLLRNKKKYRH